MYYNHLDENGVILEERITLNPLLNNIPSNHSFVPYVEPVESVKLRIIDKLKTMRDTKVSQGGYKVGEDWFHSDPFSRIQHLGLTMLGNNLPNNIDWKTLSGKKLRLTPPIAQQIFLAAVTQDNAIFSHTESLIAQVKDSTNPESVDITQGWPETYQGV